MNKNIGSALIAFSNMRDSYFAHRDEGKSDQEAHLEIMKEFSEIPIVEIAIAMTVIVQDYEKIKSLSSNPTRANLFMIVSNQGANYQRSPAL